MATPFSQRSTKCAVQFVFNEHLIEAEVPDVHKLRRCRLEVLGSGPKSGCRYMADQLESRFNELERRMKMFSRAFSECDSRSLSQNVAYASQEKVLVVGRICYNAEEGEPNVVLLEGSVEYSGGQRVRLDLRELSQYSLFPGQIVAVEGHNPSGHCLVATRIIDSIPLPPYAVLSHEAPAAKKQAISMITETEAPGSLTILVASGPFTTSDNLSFEPLVELLCHARIKKPNVLLLMGPFIDAEHPHVKNGTVDKLAEHLFQEEVATRIEDYCEALGENARVILVPSTRDAFHDRIFPQPPFEARLFEDPSRQIALLPNPSVCCVDEIAIGCCTTDILRHLSSEELSCGSTTTDRMSRLGAHLIGQRSFYPLFPPALGTSLDVSLAPGALELTCTPDIVILPSDLVPVVKALSFSPGIRPEDLSQAEDPTTSLIVNPGRLAKGTMGGSFIEIFVAPPPPSPLSSDQQEQQPSIAGRTKISFLKI